ncbi:PREDICTED: uncharacterized protein C6orf136 homolog [Thamnophis sirtalis]|uniref:Uncharacterized protein C6orf136 homolog n=1 Tax=Thamnophis sirtalis TaxID=35019 RepID=A0A6I9XUJ1_9SAUR|nr:PREDICTED: uncharacterized protein C6orf136 homolog [Thamnophis sirtalis]
MYQRSPKAALRVGARCSWRWDGSSSSSPFRLGQGDSARCCHPARLRPRDVAASWDKLSPELISSTPIKLTFPSLFSKKLSEAAPHLPALSHPSAENCTVIQYGLKFSSLETRPLFHPAVSSPPESMEDAIILENGRQEGNLSVRPSEGLDSASLDSLYSLFHDWHLQLPYPTSEAAPASLAPFQATSRVPSPVTSPTSSNRDMEEHLEVMHQKLREELPGFFSRTHNYAMYSRDVEFINEILHLKTRGLMLYQLAVILCRFVAWNYFIHMHLEVMKVTQHPENWSIQVRWRIRGLPFHVFLMRFFRNKPEFYRVYDAYSTFFLNPQGLIKCHKVSKLMPSQPLQNKLKNLAVASLLGLELSDQRPSLLPWLVSSKGHQDSIGGS